MGKENEVTQAIVEISAKDGVAFIEQASPLTRLHYFDGKFLRADAFALEQDYHRARTRLANLAGGWGAVHGLGVSLAGNTLQVGAGLAITAAGNFVLATADLSAALADLIEVAQPAPASGNAEFDDCLDGGKKGVTEGTGLTLYEITVGPVEGLCGNEAVYGKLCESACVSSSQHPYWREGVVLRLRPISLKLPTSSAIAFSNVHLRNRVASGYFAAEPWLTPPALSSAGLASELWCNPASLYGRDEVVIGLLVREAGINRVIDAWSGRRERMDTQARGYWQGRMAMRPWNVFVAQILQFQCQLAGLFDGTGGVITPPDDCDQLRQLLDKTRKDIEALHKRYSEGTQKILKQFGDKVSKKETQNLADEVKLSYAELYDISSQLNKVELGQGALPQNRMLLNAGFVELPPAGYLPVIAGKQPLPEQLSRFFGEGVRLHYHAVRRDEIAHLVEEAQHMKRISLTRGLDDKTRIEDVEIFVPDGEAYALKSAAPGEWWQVEMAYAALGAFDLGFLSDDSGSTTLAGDGTTVKKQVLDQANESLLSIAQDAPQPAAAKKTTRAKAAAKATLAAAQTPQEELRELVLSLLRQPLRGLARTEGGPDGSYAFTLVVTLDVAAVLAQIRALLKAHPELDPKGTYHGQLDNFANFSIYLSGDIAADPLSVALGASIQLNGEMRMGKISFEISGSLTALFDRPLSGGGTERVLQARLVALSGEDKATQSRAQISLFRKGDAADGQFVMDDAQHDPATTPNIFEWEENPRTAGMFVLEESEGTDATSVAKETIASRLMKGLQSESALKINTGAAATGLATHAALAALRKQLLKMNGLSAMPALDSAIGAAAMNALIRIADQADDPAFLARARKRLFPTLDTPSAEGVRALLDWVMFRRARTHLCCPQVPTTPVKPALEAFQAWHLQVGDAAALKALQDALERNDAQQLAQYKFQRVGMLRYRDENVEAEETEAQIEAMWSQAQPGSQVVLGRYWEQRPTTGQGWQNHFRLRRMLDQIAEITAPPVRGDGALARLQAVSPPLSDGAMDGGFLVVTQRVEAITRRALLIYGNWDRPNHFVNSDSPRADQVFVNDAPQGNTLSTFINALGANRPVRGVTIATTRAAPDSGGTTRIKSVVAALVAAGLPTPAASRQTVEAINDNDRRQIISLGVQPDDYDEVIFFELNGGA